MRDVIFKFEPSVTLFALIKRNFKITNQIKCKTAKNKYSNALAKAKVTVRFSQKTRWTELPFDKSIRENSAQRRNLFAKTYA